MVPFIDLKRFEPDFLERWQERVMDITRNTRFVSGPDVAGLEARLAELSQTEAVVGCANGTDALQLSLRAAGVGAGDIVLIPDATFWATFEAVVNVGARPVTVDIDPSDLQMNFELFQEAVESYSPAAAILVHLYGWGSAQLDAFRALCQEREIPLIEDGAQSWGTTWQGQSIYAGAHMSTVSFYPAKVLGACGDAGAVLCSSQELADRVRTLGNHGRSSHYSHGIVGWNSRMSGFDAAFLDLCLDYLPARLDTRRKAAQRYVDALADLSSDLRFVAAPEGYEDNGYLSVALAEPALRSVLAEALGEAGIGFGQVYPGAMSDQPGADEYLVGAVGGAEAARLGSNVINLPLFAYIEDEEIEQVIEVVTTSLKGLEIA